MLNPVFSAVQLIQPWEYNNPFLYSFTTTSIQIVMILSKQGFTQMVMIAIVLLWTIFRILSYVYLCQTQRTIAYQLGTARLQHTGNNVEFGHFCLDSFSCRINCFGVDISQMSLERFSCIHSKLCQMPVLKYGDKYPYNTLGYQKAIQAACKL